MKYATILVLLFILLTHATLFGQVSSFDSIPQTILERLPEMGTERSPLMNSHESDYFNVIFKNVQNDFDFTGKKIGFITGSNAGTVSNKKNYFDLEKERLADNYTTNNSTVDIFNAVEKEQSGGFDAVIVYWVKIGLPREELVKRLKAHNP